MVGLVVGLSYVCGVFLVYFYGDVQGDTGQWVWELGPGIGKGDLGLGMGRGLIACGLFGSSGRGIRHDRMSKK